MNILLHYVFLSLIPVVMLLHLSVAPYTKVEESFNIQAIHDILRNGVPFSNISKRLTEDYDHVTFPGSVPRTFVGALILSVVARPFTWIFKDGKQLQILVRAILGSINAFSLIALQQAVSQAFGKTAGYWYILLQASQFHVMYYASRTLPNFFAFPFVVLSLRNLIVAHFGRKQKKARRCQASLGLLTVAGVIFRAELALLLACLTSTFVISIQIPLRHVIIPAGLGAAVLSVVVSVPIDSFFWQRFPVWPELNALLYNTVEGKSSEWGTSPWHYYFTNSIPKLMLNPLSLLAYFPIALFVKSSQRISLDLVVPLIAFVAVYSFLPHKEWRFIVYVIPGLTAVASVGAAAIWTRRKRSEFHNIASLVLVGSVLGSFLGSLALLCISSLNYPGGEAIQRVQMIGQNSSQPLRIHLDNLSCQSGVTRFLQDGPGDRLQAMWAWDKTEDAPKSLEHPFWKQFDYVLLETPDTIPDTWSVTETVEAHDGLSMKEGVPIVDAVCSSLLGARGVTLCSSLGHLEEIVSKRFARGRWPRIKLAPRIWILKNEDAG